MYRENLYCKISEFTLIYRHKTYSCRNVYVLALCYGRLEVLTVAMMNTRHVKCLTQEDETVIG